MQKEDLSSVLGRIIYGYVFQTTANTATLEISVFTE